MKPLTHEYLRAVCMERDRQRERAGRFEFEAKCYADKLNAERATVAKMRAALEEALSQAEGCFANHYGDNPEGAAEPRHITMMKAALATDAD